MATPPTPTLTTQASPSIPLGGMINDVATLSGGNNPTGTITFDLYGPNDNICGGTSIFTSVANVDVGNGVYTSAPFTPLVAGVYRWVANYSGDDNNAPTANVCNMPNENVTITPPTPKKKRMRKNGFMIYPYIDVTFTNTPSDFIPPFQVSFNGFIYDNPVLLFTPSVHSVKSVINDRGENPNPTPSAEANTYVNLNPSKSNINRGMEKPKDKDKGTQRAAEQKHQEETKRIIFRYTIQGKKQKNWMVGN